MVEKSGWVKITEADPQHSSRYIERFRAMDAAGDDLAGEARLVDVGHAPIRRGLRVPGSGPGIGYLSRMNQGNQREDRPQLEGQTMLETRSHTKPYEKT